MKKNLLLAGLVGALLLSACSTGGSSSGKLALNVGATALPHAEILNFVKEDLAKEGVDLTVTEFGDYTLLNPSLFENQIDANFFQHQPYLENYVENSKHDLVPVFKVHTEPIGIYSSKITSIDELADGATVAIPNDATNEARALLLLEKLGLIKLKEGVGFKALPSDVVDNPKNLKFSELEAATLPRVMDESDISIINTNYALEANLNPANDAIAMEEKDSPYANAIVVNAKDKDSEAIQKLIKVLSTDKVRTFINETYSGAVVPSF